MEPKGSLPCSQEPTNFNSQEGLAPRPTPPSKLEDRYNIEALHGAQK
jgi:hypothetical protein